MSISLRNSKHAHVVLMGEGEYDVPIASDRPVTLGELLGGLGISDRDGHLYLDGAAADTGSVVQPGSRAEVLPRIYGG
jgi:hypothetical protein